MFKSRIICLAILISFTPIANASTVSDVKKKLIDEIVAAGGSNKYIDDVAKNSSSEVREYLASEGIELDEEFVQRLEVVINEVIETELLNSEEVQYQTYQLWDKNFSLKELREIVRFHRTTTGQKLNAMAPDMVATVTQAIVASQETFVFALQVRILEELKAAGYDIDGLFQAMDIEAEQDQRILQKQELDEVEIEICEDGANSGKPVPLFRGRPQYPPVAQHYAVEGWVELYFTVNEMGRTEDIYVSSASAGALFNLEAIQAVEQYRYCPGSRFENTAIRIRFEMQL